MNKTNFGYVLVLGALVLTMGIPNVMQYGFAQNSSQGNQSQSNSYRILHTFLVDLQL